MTRNENFARSQPEAGNAVCEAMPHLEYFTSCFSLIIKPLNLVVCQFCFEGFLVV
ncbi:MAG: hypothetical protein ACFKPT_31875 [Gloeotrichia echinulata GP01]